MANFIHKWIKLHLFWQSFLFLISIRQKYNAQKTINSIFSYFLFRQLSHLFKNTTRFFINYGIQYTCQVNFQVILSHFTNYPRYFY